MIDIWKQLVLNKGVNGRTPHIVQYQGSKRLLASQILKYMPRRFNRLFEPFSGMAAVTIAVAKEDRAKQYYINDINEPIVRVLQMAINDPFALIEKYTKVWSEQFSYGDGHLEHFYCVRNHFNNGEQTAENMLYLLARCVKGSVRYGKNGNFNQSPDKRRHGTNPKNMAENISAISTMLKGKTVFSACDYREVFEMVKSGDLVYMDPPYQGVSTSRDNRYLSGLSFDEFCQSIETLNKKKIDYIISYDGECGEREYGKELPKRLHCTKYMLNAGISTQSTLLGRKNTTLESLYVSKNIVATITKSIPKQMALMESLYG